VVPVDEVARAVGVLRRRDRLDPVHAAGTLETEQRRKRKKKKNRRYLVYQARNYRGVI
jgi:hypothetical protein